eukprot:m.424977 g.424977  ORF g.424977 m.424977 type:complete len:149 (-) comp21342_c2_seq11:1886-2332(-)
MMNEYYCKRILRVMVPLTAAMALVTDAQLAPQWTNVTSGCAGRAVVNSSCAELLEDMLYVDYGVSETTEPSMLGGGFIWSPGAAPDVHSGCAPGGATPTTNCGRGIFRFYCATHAVINFQAEMKAYFRTVCEPHCNRIFWCFPGWLLR